PVLLRQGMAEMETRTIAGTATRIGASALSTGAATTSITVAAMMGLAESDHATATQLLLLRRTHLVCGLFLAAAIVSTCTQRLDDAYATWLGRSRRSALVTTRAPDRELAPTNFSTQFGTIRASATH